MKYLRYKHFGLHIDAKIIEQTLNTHLLNILKIADEKITIKLLLYFTYKKS